MAHGISHSITHTITHAVQNPLSSVTRDLTSGIYRPATGAEWATLLSVAGDAEGGPSSVWRFEEASGSLADAVGNVTLAQSGAGHLYQQAVAGWASKCVRTVDATAGQKWVNSTTAPNSGTQDVLLLLYVDMPAGSPAAIRDVATLAAAADLRFNTTGKLRAVFGASADLVQDPRGAVRFVAVQVNNTGAASLVFTDQEKFTGTYATPASASFLSLGGHTASAAGTGFVYGAQFVGQAARRSAAQIKTIAQTLGWTIPWT